MDNDLSIRMAAFQWLAEQTAIYGEDVLPRSLLQQGFHYKEEQVHLIGPQGIFKPRIMDLPLSITTAPDSPYDDEFNKEILHYRYRGDDPQHRDNIGLRRVMSDNRPLVYFFGLVKSRYFAVWPVYVIGDDPVNLSFKVVVDDMNRATIQPEKDLHAVYEDSRRHYLTTEVRVRLHQRTFRERVLEAYRSQCALCCLRHRELLDAAHILPDPHPQGQPVVRNGLALCKLHHAAFDSYLLTVSPDFIVHIRKDILEEEDGPVLQHALKGLEHSKIFLPKNRNNWPDREALEWRYSRFQEMR